MPPRPLYEPNDTVRTSSNINLARVFMAPKIHLKKRGSRMPGVVIKKLNKDDYLVLHPEETVPTIYHENELQRESNAYWKAFYVEENGIPYFKEFWTYHDAKDFMLEFSGEINGPYFSTKEELEEGTQESKDLFSHLTDDF